jgi:hypothetical protein
MRPSNPKGLHCWTHFCSNDGTKPTSMAPARQAKMKPPNAKATIQLRRTSGRSFMLHNVGAQRAAKPSHTNDKLERKILTTGHHPAGLYYR